MSSINTPRSLMTKQLIDDDKPYPNLSNDASTSGESTYDRESGSSSTLGNSDIFTRHAFFACTLPFGMDPTLTRIIVAEALGSFILIFCICGIIAITQIMKGQVGLLEYAVTAAFTVIIVVFSIGGISGAHVNPAVTIAFATSGPFPWSRACTYILLQAGRKRWLRFSGSKSLCRSLLNKSTSKIISASTAILMGTELLCVDVLVSLKLFMKQLRGEKVTERERKKIEKTLADIATLVPVTILMLILVSVVGHATMSTTIKRYIPALIPSPYSSERLNMVKQLKRTKKMEIQARRSNIEGAALFGETTFNIDETTSSLRVPG